MYSDMVMVAAIQMNCVLEDKSSNLSKAKLLIEQAINNGAKIIVLPELFSTGYRVEDNDYELAEEVPGPTTDWLEKICRNAHVYIIGCLIEKDMADVYDTAVVIGPNGIIGKYRKIQLWDLESTRFKGGQELPVFNIGIIKIGIQICYEIGFPEGTRSLTLKGADLIIYPSAFGKARHYAWDIASRARALENGVYIIAANRSGTEKIETVFNGRSRIIDPQGQILKEASHQLEEVIFTEIDRTVVERQRKALPYLEDLQYYKGLI